MTLDLPPRKETAELFRKYRFYPSRKLGQNFLIDESVIKKFLKAANLKLKDTVLEIGPGPGNLTQEIAGSVKRVIAVEKDPQLIRILNDELRIKNIKNVRIVEGDILKIPHSTFNIPHSYKVMGNLPFYLTSPVIRKFLESKNPPKQMVFFIQKEVAQRICSRPPKMNFLAVSVQYYAKPEIIAYVSKKSFWPQPKVDSAIIKISKIESQRLKVNTDLFFEIARAGFSQPRKQLANNLAKKLGLNKEETAGWLRGNKISPSRRAETLEINDWVRLTQSFTRARQSRAKDGDEGKL